MNMGTASQPSDDQRHAEQRALLAAMARGDKQALAGLYDQLSGPLYSLAYRMLGDNGEAQDLVQVVATFKLGHDVQVLTLSA